MKFANNDIDLIGLPPELLKELRVTRQSNACILSLFAEAGGTLCLTRLLIAYYRKFNKVKTRQQMMAACYALTKKGLLRSEKQKGTYTLTDNGRAII